MQIESLEQKKTPSLHPAISILFFLLLVVAPISAYAQHEDSIAALRQMGKAFSSIVEKASPAVVGLKAEMAVARDSSAYREWPFDDDVFEFFFGPRTPRPRTPRRRYPQPVTSMGSGFIISPDGYILTNNHMVADAKEVEIKLADGREFVAEIIGTDPESDVAVVKIMSFLNRQRRVSLLSFNFVP